MSYTLEMLQTEISDPKYDNLSYLEIYNILSSQSIPVLGAIAGDDLRNVVSILCQGIAFKIKTMPTNPVGVALETAFDKMTLQNFQFNFAAPDVVMMLDMGVSAGYITEDERSEFYKLAVKQKPLWEGLTIKDVIAAKNPELLNNPFIEIGEIKPFQTTFVVHLVADLPAEDTLVLQESLSINGSLWADYKTVTVESGIQKAGLYPITIPANSKFRRRLRWRCNTYNASGIISAI